MEHGLQVLETCSGCHCGTCQLAETGQATQSNHFTPIPGLQLPAMQWVVEEVLSALLEELRRRELRQEFLSVGQNAKVISQI